MVSRARVGTQVGRGRAADQCLSEYKSPAPRPASVAYRVARSQLQFASLRNLRLPRAARPTATHLACKTVSIATIKLQIHYTLFFSILSLVAVSVSSDLPRRAAWATVALTHGHASAGYCSSAGKSTCRIRTTPPPRFRSGSAAPAAPSSMCTTCVTVLGFGRLGLGLG